MGGWGGGVEKRGTSFKERERERRRGDVEKRRRLGGKVVWGTGREKLHKKERRGWS